MDDKLKIIKALIKGSKFVITGQQPDFERVETVQHVALLNLAIDLILITAPHH